VHGAALAALNAPAVGKRLTDLGYVIIGDQPGEFAAHLKTEIASLAKVLKGIRVE
jgi:tripartite-type tricarboxylate transporter receptor subunit TctC